MKSIIKFFKYLWNDKPSMWLWFIFIVAGIGYADTDLTATGLLLIAAGNITFMVNGRGRFTDAILEYSSKFSLDGLLNYLNLRPSGKRIFDRSIFDWVIIIIMILAGLFFAVMIVYQFLRK